MRHAQATNDQAWLGVAVRENRVYGRPVPDSKINSCAEFPPSPLSPHLICDVAILRHTTGPSYHITTTVHEMDPEIIARRAGDGWTMRGPIVCTDVDPCGCEAIQRDANKRALPILGACRYLIGEASSGSVLRQLLRLGNRTKGI